MTEQAHKDKKNKYFDKNFAIKVCMSSMDPSQYEMIDKLLPKMPRKVKESKKGEGSKSKEKKKKSKSKSKGRDSSMSSIDSDSNVSIDSQQEKIEMVQVKVPVEKISSRQKELLELA